MDTKPTIELRLNNTIFKCVLDEKWYNLAEVKAYAIAIAVGIMPQGKQAVINMNSQLICESCWLGNKPADNLNFKEPSQIVTAPASALSGIKRSMN